MGGVSVLMKKNEIIGNGIGSVVVSMLPIPFGVAIFTGIQSGFSEALVVLLMWLFWVGIISLLASIFIGTPIYLILKCARLNSWISMLVAGAIVGAGIGLYLFPYGDKFYTLAILGGIGAYGAVAYKYGAENLSANK